LVFELADPVASDTSALTAIERRFPAAAMAQLEFAGVWADLAEAALVNVRFPAESN
jgi:hypothetical protein